MPVLLSSEQLNRYSFPIPPFLVEPIIVQAGTVLLHGKPGVGKTQFVMTLARAIDEGHQFLGRWKTARGRVVIFQVDMASQIQQLRLRSALADAYRNTYWVIEPGGGVPSIDICTMAFRHAELVRSVRELNPVLVVWDTLRKIHTMSENASETVVTVLNSARRLFPTATHLFVHHDRKESRNPDSSPHPEEDFMGNQQWKGSVDTQIQLRDLGPGNPKRIACLLHRARTAGPQECRPMVLEMDPRTLLLRKLP